MGEGPYVIDLDRSSFNQSLAFRDPTAPCLIEFYASWCGHCIHFAPEWKKMTQAWHGYDLSVHGGVHHELFVARVDCAKEVDILCKQFNVPSFPHITMAAAGAYQSRNISAIKIHKQTIGAVDAKHLIKWTAEELKGWGIKLDNSAIENVIQRSTKEDQLVSSTTSPLSSPSPPPLLPIGVLWTHSDVVSSSIYLFQTITQSSTLIGPEKRLALKFLLRLWSLAHPSIGCKEGSLSLIMAFDSKVWPDQDQSPKGSFMQDYPICGSKALERYLKSSEERYVACRGSKEGTRGFTCGLWLLFHTMSVALPEWKSDDAGLLFMEGLKAFAQHFFLCRDCAMHFNKLLDSPSARSVKTKREAIMWVWRTHNEVNVRLMEQEKELPSHSSDPLHPKTVFPSVLDCPLCRRKVSSGSQMKDEDWDMDQVLNFLAVHYGSQQEGVNQAKKSKDEAINNADLVKDSSKGSDPSQWLKEEVKSSDFSTEQLSSSWAYLEINLVLVVFGLFIVGSIILSSFCMRGARGKDSRIKFHYASENV